MSRKLTESEIKEMVHDYSEGKFEYLGGYVGALKPFNIKCTKCGEDYEKKISTIKHSNSKCYCEGGQRQWNSKKIQDFLDINKPNWKLVEYRGGTKSKSKFICDKGHEIEMIFSHIQQGQGCGKCFGLHRTTDEVVEMLNELQPNWKLIEYSGKAMEKSKFICDKGHEIEMSFNSIQSGIGCGKCCGLHRTNEEIEELLKELQPNWKLIEYSGKTQSKSKFICDKGHTIYMRLNTIKSGIGCGKCCGLHRTNEEIEELLKEFHKHTIEFGNFEYNNAHTKNIPCKCKQCNFEWFYSFDVSYYQKSGCPVCSSSKGEKIVYNLLMDTKVEFTPQYTFSDLKTENDNRMRLDFAVFTDSGVQIIEYHGEQHYKSIEYFGGEERLKIQQKRDDKKREYMENNNIDYLEIPYTYSDEEVSKSVLDFINFN